MNRLEEVRKIVNKVLTEQLDLQESHYGYYVHLYGVSNFSSLLALKRGLDPELCGVAGMLHDIWTYKTGCSMDHGRLGSIEARKILGETNYFNEEEMDIICSSIFSHSNKQDIDNPYCEVLKDADVLQHYLYNTKLPIIEKEKERLNMLLMELGINPSCLS